MQCTRERKSSSLKRIRFNCWGLLRLRDGCAFKAQDDDIFKHLFRYLRQMRLKPAIRHQQQIPPPLYMNPRVGVLGTPRGHIWGHIRGGFAPLGVQHTENGGIQRGGVDRTCTKNHSRKLQKSFILWTNIPAPRIFQINDFSQRIQTKYMTKTSLSCTLGAFSFSFEWWVMTYTQDTYLQLKILILVYFFLLQNWTVEKLKKSANLTF